jgi:hypothetical protein
MLRLKYMYNIYVKERERERERDREREREQYFELKAPMLPDSVWWRWPEEAYGSFARHAAYHTLRFVDEEGAPSEEPLLGHPKLEILHRLLQETS